MLAEVEFAILDAIQAVRFGLLDKLMVAITTLGNEGAVWIVIGIVMLFFKKYRRAGVTVLLGLIFGLVTGNWVIKNIVARARPCAINTAIELIIPYPSEYSFPSGHTLSSFIAATCVFLRNKKFGAATYVLASLIAFSRLYVYVHFPTDIIGGVLLGIALAHLATWIMKKPQWKWLGE